MTNKPDWMKAAELPPDELDRLLAEDHDEVDDNPELTDEDLAEFKPAAEFFTPEQLAALPKRRPGQRGKGRRQAKVQLTIRVEPETLEAWRATGEGWQGRISDVLRERAPKVEKRRA